MREELIETIRVDLLIEGVLLNGDRDVLVLHIDIQLNPTIKPVRQLEYHLVAILHVPVANCPAVKLGIFLLAFKCNPVTLQIQLVVGPILPTLPVNFLIVFPAG